MDSGTLIIALVTVALAATTIVFVGALFRKALTMRLYAVGFVCGTLGFAFQGGWDGPSPWSGLVIAKILAMAFLFLLVIAMRVGAGHFKPAPWRFVAYGVLGLLIVLGERFLPGQAAFGESGNSLLAIGLAVEFLVAFYRSREGEQVAIRWAVGLHCAAFVVFHMVRMILVLGQFEGIQAGGETSLIGTFTILGNLFFIVSWVGVILGIDAATMTTALENKNAVLRELASTDQLTGLYNRHLLTKKMDDEIERSRRYGQALSMIMFDIDHFKLVNDNWGHAQGDQVLVRLAKVAGDLIRESDLLFRWGGEEFIILAPHTCLAGAMVLAEKLRAAFEEIDFPELGRVTSSFGVTEWQAGESPEEWFKRVDRALYRAKSAGRNRVVVLAADDRPPLAMVRVEWSPEWVSGNATIDQQHRLLFEMANQLLDLSLSSASPEAIAPQLDRLLEHVIAHFADEERILLAVAYPDLAAHHRMHQRIIVDAQELKRRFMSGGLDQLELFNFLVGEVVLEHLKGVDTQYFPWTMKRRDV